jgi:hypothetical protein
MTDSIESTIIPIFVQCGTIDNIATYHLSNDEEIFHGQEHRFGLQLVSSDNVSYVYTTNFMFKKIFIIYTTQQSMANLLKRKPRENQKSKLAPKNAAKLPK